MPKVSVIIPVFNSELFICDAIESVLKQTYQDFELIVVDDGSQDQTAQRIRQYSDKLTYLYQPNSGVAKARNLGHSHSCGEYLAFLDSDDRWYPNLLEIEVRAMDENPQAGLVYSDVDLIGEDGELLQEQYLARRAKRKKPTHSIIGTHWIPFPSASLKRRDTFEKAGCFDVSFYQGGGRCPSVGKDVPPGRLSADSPIFSATSYSTTPDKPCERETLSSGPDSLE